MIVIVCVNTALVLPQSSVTVHVLVYVPACGHDPATKLPDVLLIFVTSPSQLSVATGKKPCAAVSPAASSHSSVVSREFACVVHTGAVVSMIVIVCVNTALVLPQSSVPVHVLVYVPPCSYDLATKLPDVLLIFVTSPSQLSVATGKKPCAAVSPAASSHSNVVSREPAGVVHTGAVVSMIVIVCVNTALVLPQSSVTVQVLV